MSARHANWQIASLLKVIALTGLAAGLGGGATCTIRLPDPNDPGGGGSTGSYVPLDQADAVVTIRQEDDQTEADVLACFTDNYGRTITLQNGQSVAVNARTLTGPIGGYYARTVTAADSYTVTVNEPTRGVLDTAIASPGGFTITAPAAGEIVSLQGFTVSWSSPDPELDVGVTLSQTLLGQEQTEEFGPFADSGVCTFDDDDLISFGQGVNLNITVTRIREQLSIDGFNSGELSVEHARTVTATPGP